MLYVRSQGLGSLAGCISQCSPEKKNQSTSISIYTGLYNYKDWQVQNLQGGLAGWTRNLQVL